MKFSPDRAKEGAIDTGAALVGAVVGIAIIKKASDLIAQKSPSSTIARHVPAIALGLVLAAQAFDVVPDNDMVEAGLQGVAVVSGMQTIREYTGANTAAGMTATSGIAALVNQFVPALQVEGITTAGLDAHQMDQLTTIQNSGTVEGLGLLDYSDPSTALLAAGREQEMMFGAQPEPRNLGTTPAPQPKFLG